MWCKPRPLVCDSGDMVGMPLSTLRFPLFLPEANLLDGVVVVTKTRVRERVARTISFFVIAGVSEAIRGLAQESGLLRRCRSSQ